MDKDNTRDVKHSTDADKTKQNDPKNADRAATNQTVPYAADQHKEDSNKESKAEGEKNLRSAAEKSVIDKNGEGYRSNPNFEDAVKEASDQISKSNESTAWNNAPEK